MRYINDHDLHIHSYLSLCSKDPEQNAENIFAYGKRNGFKEICVTDHFWDEGVPTISRDNQIQNREYISRILPLPQSEDLHFNFGCEAELDKDNNLGILPDFIDKLDFVIIATTHMHVKGIAVYDEDYYSNERRAELWVERFDNVLERDLPFNKVGIAHLACPLLAPNKWEDHMTVLDSIDDKTMHELFSKAAKKGIGVELNFHLWKYKRDEYNSILRPFKIAKTEGCKFYFGSDSHHPKGFDGVKEEFETLIDLLELTEDDHFRIGK